MGKALIVLIAALFSGLSFAQLPPELDSIVQKVKPRASVLEGVAIDSKFGSILPKQYPICLYASLMAASRDGTAHAFLLTQIDFMVENGMGPESIRSLIAYGHALSDYSYAAQANRPLSNPTGDDLLASAESAVQSFKKLKCVETFANKQIQDVMMQAIKSSLAMQ